MSKARILAVDDQRYFRELIEGQLVEADFTVDTAESGDEALALLEQEDYEVVLTDLMMPGMDGVELLQRIKERLPEQNVIIVTGVVDVNTAVEAMKQGATDYVLKPFDRAALTGALDKILDRRQLRDEHSRLMSENLEYMGVLSLFERAAGLFGTLQVEPLAERLLEGLCLETGAESGIIWLAADPGRDLAELAGCRGMVRLDNEPDSIRLSEAFQAGTDSAGGARSQQVEGDADGGETLLLPIRAQGLELGMVRLSDKFAGARFETADRAAAEKFCEFGGIAVHNALRFRALERRSLRDSATRAYSAPFLDEALEAEIQKSARFGHRFSLVRIEIEDSTVIHDEPVRDELTLEIQDAAVSDAARRIEGTLRGADVFALGADGAFRLLLPQTDALGAGILVQRIRSALAALWEGQPAPAVGFATATYPVDGTQVETLGAVLRDRVENLKSSLVTTQPKLVQPLAMDPMLDQLLELGSVESAEVEGQILRFVLEDVARRPVDRGVLFVSPGIRWLPDVLDTLHELRGRTLRSEIVVVGEGKERDPHPQVTWVTKSNLDSRRPFLVYFGDGPAYAMIGQMNSVSNRTALFQTADRDLVEHLAFELQRELGIVLSV